MSFGGSYKEQGKLVLERMPSLKGLHSSEIACAPIPSNQSSPLHSPSRHPHVHGVIRSPFRLRA
jgi:hypothetical protein